MMECLPKEWTTPSSTYEMEESVGLEKVEEREVDDKEDSNNEFKENNDNDHNDKNDVGLPKVWTIEA